MYMYMYMIMSGKWPFSRHSSSQMQFCSTLVLPTKVTTCWLNNVLCTCFSLTFSKTISNTDFCTNIHVHVHVYLCLLDIRDS